MPCVVASVGASDSMYFSKDSGLRGDPSHAAPYKTTVPAGAPVLLSTCDGAGWCFGKVYDMHEGWVLFEELLEEHPLKIESGGGLRRASYFVLSSGLQSGRGSLKRVTNEPLLRSAAWTLAAGAGLRWESSRGRRFEAELLVGLLREKRSRADEIPLRSTGAWAGLGLKYLQPHDEIFEVGVELRPMLRFPVPEKGFLEGPAPFLISLGPLVRHGFGNETSILALWRPAIIFNSREVFLGLGLDILF